MPAMVDSHYYELEPINGVATVRFGDTEIVRSKGAVWMREYNGGQAMPPLIYFPRADVPVDTWEKSGLTTGCPIKGKCEYWAVEVDGQRAANAMWSYTDVRPGAENIKDWVSFDGKRFEVSVG